MKDLIRRILKESEDEFDWVGDLIPTNYDLSPGIVYYKFGVNENTKDFIAKDICSELNDVEYVNGRIILDVASHCDFTDLFYEDRRGSDGYINRYIAEKVLCEDDGEWWEPYHSSDLVQRRDWKSVIWDDMVLPHKDLVNEILIKIKNDHVSQNDYNPNQLDIFLQLPPKQNVITVNGKILNTEYFNYLTNNLDELGDLIDDEEDFEDIKYQLLWAYGDAYNQVARDNIYKAAIGAIDDYFGEGTRGSKEVQRYSGTVTKEVIRYDITNLFFETVFAFFDNCYSGAKDIEDLEQMDENYPECSVSYEHSSFLSFLKNVLNESDEQFQPRYNEFPDDDDIKTHFVESAIDRI